MKHYIVYDLFTKQKFRCILPLLFFIIIYIGLGLDFTDSMSSVCFSSDKILIITVSWGGWQVRLEIIVIK